MCTKAWTEKVIIPTYKIGKPEKNPMFLEKRVYQGSSGVVYPHPVIEKIADEKEEQEYNAVFLENEYLMIMILPELGGRIQRAYDKVRNRDFVYYNKVIKPALVGLAGPWISGGIEFNWPQHHRPSTYDPVDFTIEENADGSKTVWVNEIELMSRTRGMAGFTLYPGKAYLEIKGRLFNRSPFSQTFLWWANPAVKVNEHYQSVFPPDVYAVFDHGKRDVSDFPIATGTYYKVDYSPGTDISRYSTIPVPTSYMAVHSDYNFIGCYEHDTEAGMLHVADRHVSPGKKQWTWGNGDFGYAWDRNLTDEDGPYIELMTGVFTDNQPDFSWLQPNEVKSFEQYFMPYALVGSVKNATKEALVNMEADGSSLILKVYATSDYKNASVCCYHDGRLIKEYTSNISPSEVFEQTYHHSEAITIKDWKVIVNDEQGNELVSWRPELSEKKEIPAPAVAAKAPQDIETIEELFLNGLHLEQYRHATFNPADYYEEALRRSPGDIRCNNAMGLLLLRRGQFAKSEQYFRNAVATLTMRNPNPYDGAPYYNLGWSLMMQGKDEEAYASFYKATWNDEWQHSGFLALARLASKKQDDNLALAHINRSLIRNDHSHTARHLKVAILRRQKKFEEAANYISASMAIDPFNYGCQFESFLINKKEHTGSLKRMKELMRGNLNNYLELSLDYIHAGIYDEALALLEMYAAEDTVQSPLLYYYCGYIAEKLNNVEKKDHYFELASKQNPDGCFPNKIEEIVILQSAIEYNPEDSVALYALGNLWYDKRQYTEAISCWQQCIAVNNGFPTAYRNLSLACYNKLNDKEKALIYLQRAFELDPTDSRVLMELDQLYKIMGNEFAQRLSMLDLYPHLIEQRDDLYLERVTLFNNLGKFDKAQELLSKRKFHPWEGGEGKVVGQFLLCHTELAKMAILKGEFNEALDWLERTKQYPENLGEGKLYGAQENDIHYLMGCAYEGLGDERADKYFAMATHGISKPVAAIYYNDPQPDKIVYQALAWKKLGQHEKAEAIFSNFIDFALLHMNDEIKIDYFAVSLPDMLVFDIDLNTRNLVHCRYLQALGYLGLGDHEKGTLLLKEVLAIDINHQGAATHLSMIPFFAQYKLATV